MVEAVDGSWVEPLWRTALALTGDPGRAQRLTARALARRGDSRDAYFTLYRRFLSPFRRWPLPAQAGRRSRAEWAAAVGLRHDGWSDEDVADLLGWRVAKVERVAADTSGRVEGTRRGLDRGQIRVLAGIYRRRRLTVAWAGLAGVLAAMFVPAFLSSREAPRTAEYPPPSPPYARPTLAAGLPTGSGVAIRYAYRLVDRYNETGHEDEWVVVTTSGERRVLAGLRGDFLKISQNGLTIAHYDREKSELTLMDVTSGWTRRVPVRTQQLYGLTLDFSLDGRYVAFQADEDPIIVMDRRHPENPATYPGEWVIGWTQRGLMTMDDDRENVWLRRPDGSKKWITSSLADPVLMSSDGTMYAHAYDRRPKVYVESLAGRGTDRTVTFKDDNVLGVERWVGSSAVIVSMQHGGYRLIDVKTGRVRPIEIATADYPEVVFGKL